MRENSEKMNENIMITEIFSKPIRYCFNEVLVRFYVTRMQNGIFRTLRWSGLGSLRTETWNLFLCMYAKRQIDGNQGSN